MSYEGPKATEHDIDSLRRRLVFAGALMPMAGMTAFSLSTSSYELSSGFVVVNGWVLKTSDLKES